MTTIVLSLSAGSTMSMSLFRSWMANYLVMFGGGKEYCLSVYGYYLLVLMDFIWLIISSFGISLGATVS